MLFSILANNNLEKMPARNLSGIGSKIALFPNSVLRREIEKIDEQNN